MVNNKSIEAFVNYNYTPFSRPQCIKRTVLIWVIGLAVSILGIDNQMWIFSIICVNILISIGFASLMFKTHMQRSARFICDGVFYMYVSILLCLSAYRMIALQIGYNGLLLVALIGLWLICVMLFVFIVYLNIKHDKYTSENRNQKVLLFPFMGGICGMVVSRLFLHSAAQETALQLLSVIVLLLSFLTSIGSLNILKAILEKNGKQNGRTSLPSPE